MSEKLDKLKSSIKFDYVKLFRIDLMESLGFIPVDKRNTVFYAIINNSNKNQQSIENAITEKIASTKLQPIPLSEEEFKEVLEFVKIKTTPKVEDNIGTSGKETAEQKIVKRGWITQQQLEESITGAKSANIPLDGYFYNKNLLDKEKIKIYLKDKYGKELISIADISVDKNISKLLPENFIEEKKAITLTVENDKLCVAMVNPDDRSTIREITLSTGRSLNIYCIPYYEYQEYIKDYNELKKMAASTKEINKIIQNIEADAAIFSNEDNLWSQVEKELQDSSGNVAKFVYKIITDAIDAKASDIHIEPRIGYYVVRCRIDGMLKKVLEIPGSIEQAAVTRFKVLARMNIAEHRRPQDGTFSIKYNDRMYDFRINTLPVGGKEKIVIRILAPAVSLKTSGEKMLIPGASDEDIKKIHDMVQSPNGIILTSGPTGSGKTTTLYTILKALNKEDVNITTIEDPVEIKLEGINQSQVNVKADITFASCMKAILRQDPDIILIGEIRDYETLEVAISAALTGHLVLSTVHTNSAAATVTRLIEMGAKDYLVSSTLTGVIAQRLVRRLCDDCKEEYYPTLEEVQHITTDSELQQKLINTKFYRSKGCGNCGGKGYVGRIGIHEVLPTSKEIKRMIAQGAHDIEIEELAVSMGMKTLKDNCLTHIINGLTTVDEFVRVLGYANE